MIVDSAIYRDGQRITAPDSLAELNAACNSGAGIAWIGLYRPDAQEFAAVAREFDLHELAVEDAVKAHQRPKLERYGDALFLVLRPARYVEESDTVEFGEVHVFAGPQFVITIRHSEAPDLAAVRHRLEDRPDLLLRGSGAIVHAILDQVVDDYEPVVAGVQNDIDEIEDDVFDGSPTVSRRIYELSREVIEFQRATKPLLPILAELMSEPAMDEEERRYLRDVRDHSLRIQEQVDWFSRAAAEHPQRQPHAGDEGAQRGGQHDERRRQEDLRLGGDLLRTHVRRHDLRHELRAHARTRVGARIPLALLLMVAHLRRPLRDVQSPRLDLTACVLWLGQDGSPSAHPSVAPVRSSSMRFHAEDLLLAGATGGHFSTDAAWWRIEIIGGDHAPGHLLVRDDARRDAGLSRGGTDDDVRFRSLVADTLNQMLHDLGDDALIDALRSSDALRIERLTHSATKEQRCSRTRPGFGVPPPATAMSESRRESPVLAVLIILAVAELARAHAARGASAANSRPPSETGAGQPEPHRPAQPLALRSST